MGNEHSQLKGLEINKKAIEVTDYWSLYHGEIPNDSQISCISIFQGETVVSGHFWTNQNPLERCIKNLKIYRHPSILKYITSWSRGSLKMLATERCRPLATCLNMTSDVQICLGLRNILCALIFLIEQANVRHLNLSISSIYVTDDGTWRLSGFEHLWSNSEFNATLLEKSKPYRYNKSIDAGELKNNGQSLEQYSFAVMCEEILYNKKEIHIPSVDDFKAYCATHLKHAKIEMRPKLSAILLHPIFNHDFILIHSFLTELPLKNPQSKQDFFTGLIDRLRNFDEIIVAAQLCCLLLSRIVLLDTTAQLCVTPFVLRPRTDDISSGLFSRNVFISHIVPKLKQVFSVRDAQIRLILLEYFPQYIDFFTNDELRDHILPQLLLGIKDTNDVLVSKTLLCLADLVPILGSSIVIGGNRGKIFADGRPQGIPDTSNLWIEARSITPVINSVEFLSGSPIPDNVDVSASYTSANNPTRFNQMPERPSPEGEDILQTNSDIELEVDEWSDWDNDLNEQTANHRHMHSIINPSIDVEDPKIENSEKSLINNSKLETSQESNKRKSKEIPTAIAEPIDKLDIKTQTFKKLETNAETDIDFFKDMEPVIEKANVLLIDNESKAPDSEDTNNIENKLINELHAEENAVQVDASRFEIKTNDVDANEDGWDDDETNGW